MFQCGCTKYCVTAVLAVLLVQILGCGKKPSPQSVGAEAETGPSAIRNQAIADYQTRLLDLAFAVAASIPEDPFIKDRCAAQEKVVEVCLRLDQPVRAVGYADQIADWRRGLCYANTAYYLAEKGYSAEQLQKDLKLAEEIASMDHGQQWRSDRIKARIAQAYAALGQKEKAARFNTSLIDLKKVLPTTTESEVPSLDGLIQKLDATIALQNYDLMKEALYAYVALFDRYYIQAEKRTLIEDKITSAWAKMPGIIRYDLLVKLADHALDHSDQVKAMEFVDQAADLVTEHQWPLENQIPMAAKLAAYRYRAGHSQKAREDVAAAWTLYKSHGMQISVIHCSETLMPLAEAFGAMGQTDVARDVYKRAIQECLANTNTKTRAEDMAAICVSMAISAVEPDCDLWQRLSLKPGKAS